MIMNGPQKILQAASLLLSALLAWKNQGPVEGTEFSGGWLTGSMLSLNQVGSSLCIAALLATFWFPQIAATTGLIASVLCLPLYLYFVAPGPCRWVFRGEYSVPLQANFVYDKWALAGMFAILVVGFVCFRGLKKLPLLTKYNPKTSDSP
jgi:hypothetical protein